MPAKKKNTNRNQPANLSRTTLSAQKENHIQNQTTAHLSPMISPEKSERSTSMSEKKEKQPEPEIRRSPRLTTTPPPSSADLKDPNSSPNQYDSPTRGPNTTTTLLLLRRHRSTILILALTALLLFWILSSALKDCMRGWTMIKELCTRHHKEVETRGPPAGWGNWRLGHGSGMLLDFKKGWFSWGKDGGEEAKGGKKAWVGSLWE